MGNLAGGVLLFPYHNRAYTYGRKPSTLLLFIPFLETRVDISSYQ